MNREVRRIVFVGLEDAVVETVAFDPVLDPDMILFRAEMSLISPGTELAIYTNKHDLNHHRTAPYPAYPGYAAVGIVEAAGSAVEDFSPGDRIFAITGHCSLAKFRPAQTFCLRLSGDISIDHAPFIRMALIGLATLCQADISAGEWLGVVGLGLVGNLAAQFGIQAGFKVIGVGRSALRSQTAAKCGIDQIVTGTPEELFEHTKSMTAGLGCRLVLDTSGTTGGLHKAIALASDGGTISLVGVPWLSDPTVAATSIMQPVFSRYLSLRGGWEWNLPIYEKEANKTLTMVGPRHSLEKNARYAMELIAKNVVRVEPLITTCIEPAAIQEVYQGLLNQRDSYLGVLIDWRNV
ncbi:MAG: zinc-binding dehydrogenase [Aggregatilineales bacterium]